MYDARMQLRLTSEMKAAIDGYENGQQFVRDAIEAALVGGVGSRKGGVVERREVPSVKSERKVVSGKKVNGSGVSVYGKILLAHLEKKSGGRSKRRHLRGDLGWVDADLMPTVLELKGLGLVGADTEEVWLV